MAGFGRGGRVVGPMLTTLRIRNLALVADLTLELAPGLNVLTGETGAGKSIILGALSLVLGQRADRGALRSGAESCTVEAVFDVRDLRAPLPVFLEENGLEPCEDHQLVLKRSFTASGTNRQFVNGSPTTLATLATIGDWLVDLHGPHEHQSLLQAGRQLAILDAFGGLQNLRDTCAERMRERNAIVDALAEWTVDERTYAQQVDLLRFQVAEITGAGLQPDEESELLAAHRRVAHGARLTELLQASLAVLAEEETSVMNGLGTLGRHLQEIVRLDPASVEWIALQEQARGALRELQSGLSHAADHTEVDPTRLAELDERLHQIQGLKRKYGATLAEVIAFGESARERLAGLESREAEVARLTRELAAAGKALDEAAASLRGQRQKLLPRLSRAVMRELSALGFRQSQFGVALTPLAEAGATGGDACEFQFAPNPGEPPRPLRAIASSGELARVMLALKTVLAAEDDVPVLVFDEVDANVGGETARAVGEKMRQIAAAHQVLCITHLAPVAAQGAAHFVVSKEVTGGRTESRVTRLTDADRVEELARMLGGATEAARRHAAEMLAPRK